MAHKLVRRFTRALVVVSVVQRPHICELVGERLLEPVCTVKNIFPVAEILVYRVSNENYAV